MIPVLDETLSLHLPAGRYTVSAAMTGGAHPTCGERTFYVSDRADLPKLHGAALYQAGLAPDAVRLLEEQGASVHALDPADIPEGATVLIGETLGAQTLDSVLQSARRGAHIVGLRAPHSARMRLYCPSPIPASTRRWITGFTTMTALSMATPLPKA